MPRDIQSYTECAAPGSAKSHKNFDGLLGIVVSSVLTNKWNFIAAFVVLLTASFIFLGCYGFLPFYLALMAALIEANDWYYNTRLLCVNSKFENCAIGTVTHQPEVSFDGDRKLNLLLAPFSRKECVEKIGIHLNANVGLLSNNSFFSEPIFFNGIAPFTPFNITPRVVPNPFDEFFLDDPNLDPETKKVIMKELSDYLDRLQSSDPEDADATSLMYNQFMIGYMDRLLSPDNTDANGEAKNFLGRYFRKDPAYITPGSALWTYIPEDYDATVNWQAQDSSVSNLESPNPYETNNSPRGLNMLFRFDNGLLTPFLHCEIDGHSFSDLMYFAMIALTAFAATVTLLCVFLGPLAALLGALGLAFLFWLLYELLFDLGGIGGADQPNVEYEDPDNIPSDDPQQNGDVVVLFGRWIMDTEHTQYFEIHPVKAYYVLARDTNTNEIQFLDTTAEIDQNNLQRLNNTMINKSLADQLCQLVNSAEKDPIPEVILRTTTHLLSYGLNTFYAGGGIT